MKHITRDDVRLITGFLVIIVTPEIIERVFHLFGI